MTNKRKLQAKMIEAGYSQKTLADAVGMSKNTMNAKINGTAQFNVGEVMKLCDVLHINTPEEKCAIFLI